MSLIHSTKPHSKPPNHRRERLRMRPTRGREAVHCGGKRNGNGNGGRERAMESQQPSHDASSLDMSHSLLLINPSVLSKGRTLTWLTSVVTYYCFIFSWLTGWVPMIWELTDGWYQCLVYRALTTTVQLWDCMWCTGSPCSVTLCEPHRRLDQRF